MSGVALGRRRDIKINSRIHGVSQTNYFLLQGQILWQGEKGEAGREVFGAVSELFGNKSCSRKDERDSEPPRATRYKEGETSSNLEP